MNELKKSGIFFSTTGTFFKHQRKKEDNQNGILKIDSHYINQSIQKIWIFTMADSSTQKSVSNHCPI